MQDFRLHVCFTESYFVRKIVRKCFRKWFNRKDNTGRDFYGPKLGGRAPKAKYMQAASPKPKQIDCFRCCETCIDY